MAQQKVPNQWQLQNTGESADQWMLREDEQRLPSHMQLQDREPGPALIETNWQPIDYQAMQAAAQRPRRGGLALTSLIILALLAVGGYLTWFYMGQPGLPAFLAPAEEVAEAPAVAITGTTTLEATMPVTEVAPVAEPVVPVIADPTPTTPPPAPTPALIEVRQATVDSQYGVNLRDTAAATGTLLRVLDNGTTHLVISGPVTDAAGGAWYQIAAADGTQGWASSDYIRVASQMLPYDQAAPLYQAAGVPAPALPAATAPVTETTVVATPVVTTTAATTTTTDTAAAAPVAAAPVTATAPLTVQPTALPVAAPVSVSLTGVISAPAGLNLRSAAASGDNVIRLLENQTPISVIGRSQDGQWIQIELADDTRGYIAAGYLLITGDLNDIPLGSVQPLTPTVASAAPAATTAPAAAATATPAPTGVAGAGTLGTATVTSVLGVNVRPQPLSAAAPLAQLNWNETAQATGRTADNQWVQVTLSTGASGWVAASAVSISTGLAALPVVQ